MFSSYEIATKDSISKVRGVNPDREDVKTALRKFVEISIKERDLREEKEKYANIIRMFVRKVRDFFASRGDLVRTYRVEYKDNKEKFIYAADVSASDKYTLPKRNEDILRLKDELTAGVFNQLFEKTVTIRIKDIVSNDPYKRKKLIDLLINAIGEEKVKEYFIKEVLYEIKNDFLEKVYQLSDEQKSILFKYVKEPLDTVKNVSHSEEVKNGD